MPEISRMREISDSANASNCGKEGMHAVARLHSLFSLPPSLWLRNSLFLPSTYGFAQFAVLTSLEDTRRSSYAYTRVYTPCTSQISTLREHTNKPPSHVCVYSIRPAYVTLSSFCFSFSSLFLSFSIRWSPIFSNLTGPYRSWILTCGQKYLTGKMYMGKIL